MRGLLLLTAVVALSDAVLSAHMSRLLDAIRRAGFQSELQFCQEIGIRQSHWAAMKAGEEHLSFTRLLLTPEVLRFYALRLLVEEGIPDQVQQEARIVQALRGKKRMARSPGPTQEARTA